MMHHALLSPTPSVDPIPSRPLTPPPTTLQIVSRFSTGLSTGGLLYTDSNGREG